MQRPSTAVDDGIIRVMPDVLANKIAAGEVVQRPASAAKELIENALDAGATRIEVIVRDAGRTLIQVMDDGCGLAPVDAVRCFERHATSKIREIEDLERIMTLGFRGEALASIAAIARVELRSRRREDEDGTFVRVEGGLPVESGPCAAEGGTSIAVRQLFFNVPARRSFLKSDATELRHVIDVVQAAALAHPGVGFVLRNDESVLVESPGNTEADALSARVCDLFGWNRTQDLVPVDEATSYLRIHGVVGRPSVRRKTRGDQFLFVNRRPVRSPYLDHAVFSVFRGLIPEGTYPFFALFLDIDPRHVDVNVHPAKSEVKFDDERGVYGMLKAVVGRALSMAEGLPRMEADAPDLLDRSPSGTHAERPSAAQPQSSGDERHAMSGGSSGEGRGESEWRLPRARHWTESAGSFGSVGPRNDPPGQLSALLYGGTVSEPTGHSAPAATESLPSRAMDAAAGDRPDLRSENRLWQLQDTYIVAPIRTGLMIVDQHAAHERILYERSLSSLDEGFGLSQQLLFPRTVDFSVQDFALLGELMIDLKSIGFDIEALSGRSVMIRGVPTGIRTGDEDRILDEVIAQYREFERSERLRGRTNLARSLARRSALRAGTRLDPLEMRALIDQLFECSQPYTSPDGKPTLVRIGAEELDRRFGRRR